MAHGGAGGVVPLYMYPHRRVGWLPWFLANRRRASLGCLNQSQGGSMVVYVFIAPFTSAGWPRRGLPTGVLQARINQMSRPPMHSPRAGRCTPTPHPLLLRSLTIPFNAIFSVVILRSVVSARTIMCLVVVITGFVVGCGGEVKLSILGVQWGLISSVAVSLNSIYTKKVLCRACSVGEPSCCFLDDFSVSTARTPNNISVW